MSTRKTNETFIARAILYKVATVAFMARLSIWPYADGLISQRYAISAWV
jgi:uncharacterized protein VirK/YbjX